MFRIQFEGAPEMPQGFLVAVLCGGKLTQHLMGIEDIWIRLQYSEEGFFGRFLILPHQRLRPHDRPMDSDLILRVGPRTFSFILQTDSTLAGSVAERLKLSEGFCIDVWRRPGRRCLTLDLCPQFGKSFFEF